MQGGQKVPQELMPTRLCTLRAKATASSGHPLSCAKQHKQHNNSQHLRLGL